mmetsp:Transcript_22057/g.61218  ORF Transcript_22057/g.61218 Transcript_22057/m.61218 type:complete len:147 (-) Transcript_22057:42-482(-)
MPNSQAVSAIIWGVAAARQAVLEFPVEVLLGEFQRGWGNPRRRAAGVREDSTVHGGDAAGIRKPRTGLSNTDALHGRDGIQRRTAHARGPMELLSPGPRGRPGRQKYVQAGGNAGAADTDLGRKGSQLLQHRPETGPVRAGSCASS